MTPVEKLQFKNAALRVLHAPGGPLSSKGSRPVPRQLADAADSSKAGMPKTSLEMTLIFDCALPEEIVRAAGADIISALKSADEIFRNVRCNIVWWKSDGKIIHEVTAAPMIQMGRCFQGWEPIAETKHPENLIADLKKFQARSRLLIVVAGDQIKIEDGKLLHDSLNPFLYHRLIWKKESGLMTGRELLQKAKEAMEQAAE